MGIIFKFIICLYLLSLILSLLGGFVLFLSDVWKWHDREIKVIIRNSNERIEENGREFERAGGDNDTDGDGDTDPDGDNTDGNSCPLEF